MASIPLPALHVQPPQEQDTLGKFQQLLALKNQMANAPLQHQVLQQQAQQGQLQTEQMQREAASQKAIMDAYTKSNGDLDKTYQMAAEGGALPQDLIKLKTASVQQQEQNIKLLQTKGERAVWEADQIAGAHDMVAKLPPDQRPAAYQATLQQLQKAGVDVSQAPPQYPGDQAFDVMGLALKSHSQQLKDLATKAEADKNAAQAAEATAQTNKINQETSYGPSGPAATAKYRFILGKMQQGQPVTPEEQAFAKSYEASEAKTTTQSDSLGVTSTNSSRPAGLATIKRGSSLPSTPGAPSGKGNPSDTKNSIVDMIGQYKADPATFSRLMLKHPDVMGMVMQKYPDFDQTTYAAKNKLIQGYTSGTQSKEINAINTAMGHVRVLDDAVDALKNGDVSALNSIGNKLGINITGQTAPAAFKLIVNRVGPEIASAYIPGGGGEAERFANEKDFSADLAPQILHNNAAVTVKLLRSKVGALENQYKNAVGRDDFNTRFITPEARAAFDKFNSASPQGGGGKVIHYKIVNGQLVPDAGN